PGAGLVEQRHAVAVAHALEVAIHGAPRVAAGPTRLLVCGAEVDSCAVLGLVVVEDRVALVVAALAQEPREHAARVARVSDARARILAIHREHVVAAERSPVAVAIARARPALDPREQPLDPRPIAVNHVARRRRVVDERRSAGVEHRHQVFRSGQNEDVAVLVIEIARYALVGLARDLRQSQRPADAERAVSRTRVVRERQLGPETEPARARRDRYRERAGPR